MLLLLAHAHADPQFDVSRGLHDAPFELTLAAELGGALYYSVDRSPPTVPYTGPISIDRTTVVRAQEITDVPSPIVTSTYIFVDDILTSAVMDANIVNDATYGPIVESSLRELPSISLVTPGMQLTEVPISMEWMDPEGTNVQANCGAYISGGTSWQYAKTSFRLLFRSEYGPGHLELDIYGDDATGIDPADEHDVLSLRSGNHDTVFYLGTRGQHLRNLFMDESQLEMGHIAPHGRFVHVYLDGAYHGIYHLRERFNAAFLSQYLGGSEDDYEAVTAGNVFDGSGAAWASVVAARSDFDTFREWVNVEDWLDYMMLNYYAGNAWDWYSWHNWQAAGPTEPGLGGFRFHSSDSDIVLYYGWDVNILSLGGPSDLFLYLAAEGHPDFRVAVADAIYRNLKGPLSAEAAGGRYTRIAGYAEDAVVAESARWGYGWWDRDGDWAVERDYLLNSWFPYRTDELWRQVRAAGWYPVEAPEVDTEAGVVAAGTVVTVSAPDASAAELWVAFTGDPRESGGAVSADAFGPDGARAVSVDHSTRVYARLRDGDTWGPIVERFYEVDEASPIVLNEWNAVADDHWLGGELGDGADAALGRRAGNGGDWIELLVTEDLDLRGWTLEMTSRTTETTLTLTHDPVFTEVRAGTILTIAEDLPEDAAYDPDGGDWRFHLRAGADGSGRYVSATPFDVTSRDWQLTLVDPDGRVRFGPAGEGVSPRDGLSSDEVGVLTTTPDTDTRRDTGKYDSATSSTFGAPNVWVDGAQDLDRMRGYTGGVVDVDPSDSGDRDEPADDTAPPDTDPPRADEPQPTACDTTGSAWFAWPLALVALRRRR